MSYLYGQGLQLVGPPNISLLSPAWATVYLCCLMPRFHPNTHITDCWGSAGNVTFYHQDGKCFWRTRSRGGYVGSGPQLQQTEIHRRALNAWTLISDEEKQIWTLYAKQVEPHKPPFDHSSHITGHNLFVSAYHGFALLGQERIPAPQPFVPFPDFRIELDATAAAGPMLQIRFRLWLSGTDEPHRYRLLTKIQVAAAGRGCNPGKMRNCLTVASFDPGIVKTSCIIPAELIGASSLQLHVHYLLIDTVTGYRSNFRKLSVLASSEAL